jgi:Repair protein Rad1/Rec1/Rad17
LDCLHVLGTQSLERTKLCFAYNAAKEIFKLELLEESGVLSTAAIPGMLPPHDDVGNSLALAFRSSPLVARMICKSETLREVIPELELVAGATIGTVSLGLVDGLEIATVGHLGECLVSVPSRGSHIVSFDVPAQHQAQPAPARSYPLHSLLGSMRGLEIAEETCITINSIGMIAIQHQVLERNIGDGSPNFVDFIMCCLEDDDDEDDNDEDDEEDEEDRGGGDREQDPTMSQEQSQRKASQQSLSLSRSQSSASTPGDAVPSMQPPKRRPVYNQENHNSDDDDEGDDDSHLPFSSAAPLFGSVVADASAGSSNAVLSPRVGDRSVRRRASQRTFSRRDRRQRLLDNNSSNNSNNQGGDNESEVSCNLLDDSEDDQHNDARRHNNNNDDDDDRYMEDELSQPLDVTDTAETCVDRDRGECSSPEIVYGRQH